MALSEVPRRKATGPKSPRRLWLDFRRGLDGELVLCPDLQSRHDPASPWRMKNSRALRCMRGGAGVGGVRFGFGCNDQNGRSEGAPSRASNGCVPGLSKGRRLWRSPVRRGHEAPILSSSGRPEGNLTSIPASVVSSAPISRKQCTLSPPRSLATPGNLIASTQRRTGRLTRLPRQRRDNPAASASVERQSAW